MTQQSNMIESAKFSALTTITAAEFAEAAVNLKTAEKVSAAFHEAKRIEPSLSFEEFISWFAGRE